MLPSGLARSFCSTASAGSFFLGSRVGLWFGILVMNGAGLLYSVGLMGCFYGHFILSWAARILVGPNGTVVWIAFYVLEGG